ncbi:SinI family autotransporter-associated protein [Escherichia coli]|uniref:SinI family autotransporter-associated protein n=1 Tax=Escherichia coli TaxID=562 RepID=UPI000A52FDAE|nr:SinI family autotransporter-associated protein [Escherichia coli]
MKLESNRNLRKVVLALAVAGYCAIPAIASAAWTTVTESTGAINGTVPWIQDTSATPVDHHVSISAKRGGSKSTAQLAVGDEVTVHWGLADAEGDTDANDASTKATIKWLRNGQEISGAEGETYTLTSADAGKKIGIKITPTTATGIPAVGAELTLADITNGPGDNDGSGGSDGTGDGSGSGDGGGSASDDIPAGPVVDNNVKVVIYKTDDTNKKNLLGTTDILATNTSRLAP